jgi:hypothetical protein
MHDPVAQTGKWLRSVVQGYFNYHAVPGNLDSLGPFGTVDPTVANQLRQRSQRHRLNWNRMGKLAARWLPAPRVLHPWPAALRRHSSKIRAVCANERTYGSVRGVSLPRPRSRGLCLAGFCLGLYSVNHSRLLFTLQGHGMD